MTIFIDEVLEVRLMLGWIQSTTPPQLRLAGKARIRYPLNLRFGLLETPGSVVRAFLDGLGR